MTSRKRRQPMDFGASDRVAPLAPPLEAVDDSDAWPKGQVARREAKAPATRRTTVAETEEGVETPPAWPIYAIAAAVSVVWAAAPIAFAVGYRGQIAPFSDDAFALSVLVLLVLGPAALVWLAAYLVRQGQRLAAESRRARNLTDDMVWPAVAAGLNATDVVQAVREEILLAGEAAEDARETLSALRHALAAEADRLSEAASASAQTARGLTETLGRERAEMGVLGESLDAQAVRVADLITQQARMVAEASDLAETQLREAEAALTARAADLTAAAGEASDAARAAGDDLNRHVARMETAGLSVAEQIRALESGLTDQRSSLVTLAGALRQDHEEFAARAETHANQLSEFISQARLSAAEMGDRTIKGGEVLRQLVAEANEQFRQLVDAAFEERAEFGQTGAQSLAAFSEAAARERVLVEGQTRSAIEALARAAEETRAAAARHAEAARHQVEQLSEAAFLAGQKANQVFESRLSEARELIERSSDMVEQAGATTARKLDEGAAAARATLEELRAMLTEIERRASELPLAARGQAEQVRAAVSDSMDELMDQARRAAEETQAIDEAFQERVQRNYQILSEAVRLMGSVALAGPLQPAEPRRPISARPRARTDPAPEAETVAEQPSSVEPAPETKPEPRPGSASEATGLRPRLRLTPTATDEEFSSVFEAAGGRAQEEGQEAEGWTWKELLSAIDEGDGEGDAARLEATLIEEVVKLGIDPAALLTKERVEEVAAVVQTGDAEGAREVVRKLTGAAIRRIARNLAADDAARLRVIKSVDRYRSLLDDAAARDAEGFLLTTLLGSEAGCAYLVLEAAAAETSLES